MTAFLFGKSYPPGFFSLQKKFIFRLHVLYFHVSLLFPKISGHLLKMYESTESYSISHTMPWPPESRQSPSCAISNNFLSPWKKYANAEIAVDRLNKDFPEALKRSIIQWAVQGKLIPQDPSDEPVETLLKRIRAEKQWLVKEEKIKKGQHESIIFKRETFYHI